MKKTEIVRILLIGIGGYGINYLEELTENNVTPAKIAGVCDVIPDIYEKFPVLEERGIPVYKSPEEFFSEQEADLAVISSPIQFHYEQVKICLLAGANVLCEKPVTTSVKGARELMELEKKTGRFVSVGYQLNYSEDVIALKKDILNGKFGKPIMMKTLQSLRRGALYYRRNNWAGRISVNGCKVNDSPFNNACAHQFQNITFLLGSSMDEAIGIDHVSAELYRANEKVENYDTAAVCAVLKNGVPVYYYTTHNLLKKKLGPVCQYEFEKATIYYGNDFGNGPINEYVVVYKDGTVRSYENISKGKRLKKLYDAIECTKNGSRPICNIGCAIPHLYVVEQLAELPVWQIREELIDILEEEGDRFCCIRNGEEGLRECYLNQKLPSEIGMNWKK